MDNNIRFFGLYSKSLDYFNLPFPCRNKEEAITSIKHSLSQDSFLLSQRDDFVLYEYPSFDAKNCVFVGERSKIGGITELCGYSHTND